MFDNPSDFLYWSGTVAIFIVSVAITVLLLRFSGSIGKINTMLMDVEAELPEAVKNIRMILEDVRVLVADATKASELVIETTEKVLDLTNKISEAIDYINVNIIQRLKLIGDVFSFVFGFLDKLGLTGKK